MRLIILVLLLSLSSCSTILFRHFTTISPVVVIVPKDNITPQEQKAAKYIMEPNSDPATIEKLRKSLHQP